MRILIIMDTGTVDYAALGTGGLVGCSRGDQGRLSAKKQKINQLSPIHHKCHLLQNLSEHEECKELPSVEVIKQWHEWIKRKLD